MKRVFLLLASIALLFSCTKLEGEGGLNTIKGYVYKQDVNAQLENIGDKYPAQDKDVFITYGADSKKVDDKTATSAEGYFEFNFLTKGDYKLFAYSDDTSDFSSQLNIEIGQKISFSKKQEEVQADTIVIYNYVSQDYNDGKALITGTVRTILYIKNTALPFDTIAAQNQEVFIKYPDQDGVLERVRTAYDGTFRFDNVMPGNYIIFALSEQQFSSEKTIASALITVTNETDFINLPIFYISNF